MHLYYILTPHHQLVLTMKETMLVLILAFAIFDKAVAVPPCSCTSQTEVDPNTGKTIGNCLTSFGGKNWCYISSSSSCPDKKQSSRNQLYWSAQACQNKGGQEPAGSGNVQPVKGSSVPSFTRAGNACSCTSQTEVDHKGKTIGNCLTSFGGKNWCYISSSSSCPDKKKSKRNQLYWSAQACRNQGGQEPAEPDLCYGNIEEKGWYAGSHVVQSFKKPNALQCGKSCCDNENCKIWVWRSRDNECHLKTDDHPTWHAADGHWSAKRNYELMLNPVVLLTGGQQIVESKGSGHRSVEVFSLDQNGKCSKTLDDLPDQRVDHTIHFFKGKIILCGGQHNGRSCLSLDKNQRFIPHSQLNHYRSYHVGAVVNDELLLVGRSNIMQTESWNGFQWVTHNANLDEIKEFEINSCMAAISKDTILMAGGAYDHGFKRTNKMLKYKNGVWERMEDYPGAAKTGHGCAFIKTPEGDSFLIAGGQAERSSYLYNIGKRQWEEVGQLARYRNGGKVLNVGGRIIMVGGNGYSALEVEEYDVYSKTWKIIPQIKLQRGQFDAAVVPGASV